MSLSQVLQDSLLILPEMALILTICVLILVDVFVPKGRKSPTAFIAICGLLTALVPVLLTYGNASHPVFALPSAPGNGPEFGFSNLLVVDKLSDFFKVIFLLASIGVVFFSEQSDEITGEGERRGEYYSLLLAAVVSAMFLVSSNNFLLLVLALETLSLSSYVLVGYRKNDRLSSEASLKYLLYGSVASGVMLFGISYIYGMAGTLDVSKALLAISMRESDGAAVLMAFVLVMAGIGFKVAAAPFHFWAPDVYQGAPTPVAAFLSVVSKAAGFSALLRVTLPLFALDAAEVPAHIAVFRGPLQAMVNQGHLPWLFWIISAITMTIGNLAALRQTDMKRLLAYSSIAHAGYILMGMAVLTPAAIDSMLFYFLVYLFTNLGAFLVVILLREKTGSTAIAGYKGFFWKSPFLFMVLFILLISLTGLPPTAGFLGKLRLLQGVVDAAMGANQAGLAGKMWFYASLAIIAGVNTAISLYYYMRIAAIMLFSKPDDETLVSFGGWDKVSLCVYCAPVLLMFLNFGPFLALASLF